MNKKLNEAQILERAAVLACKRCHITQQNHLYEDAISSAMVEILTYIRKQQAKLIDIEDIPTEWLICRGINGIKNILNNENRNKTGQTEDCLAPDKPDDLDYEFLLEWISTNSNPATEFILRKIYQDGESMSDIGKALDMSRHQISEIHQKALAMFRTFKDKEDYEPK